MYRKRISNGQYLKEDGSPLQVDEPSTSSEQFEPRPDNEVAESGGNVTNMENDNSSSDDSGSQDSEYTLKSQSTMSIDSSSCESVASFISDTNEELTDREVDDNIFTYAHTYPSPNGVENNVTMGSTINIPKPFICNEMEHEQNTSWKIEFMEDRPFNVFVTLFRREEISVRISETLAVFEWGYEDD
ncbi:hypothetical protein TKK_0017849 [Trichogramma kaykai]